MIRYLTAIAALIGTPVAALSLHYAPLNSDNSVTTPITDHSLNGTVLTYRTALNNINQRDLVSPVKMSLTHANIHVTSGPENSAYPYLITQRDQTLTGDIKDGAFYLKGAIMRADAESYNIRYHTEALALPKYMADKLSEAPDTPIKAVWHIRSNGAARLAGLRIEGEFIPYQFNLKTALLGLTQ